ncbi:MAG: hypothetical protein AAF772_19320, partial [Acidobacteriota bacterium]
MRSSSTLARLAIAAVALALMLVPASRVDASGEPPLRVLFLGNSLTFVHGGLDQLTMRMAQEMGETRPLDFTRVAVGGFALEDHWLHGPSRDAIATGGPWDWVVLQEQSGRTITAPQNFAIHAALLDAEIRAAGARTMFFLTWARGDDLAAQTTITAAICAAADALGAAVVPAGLAWAHAPSVNPNLNLDDCDAVHPSDQGAFLNGLVFFRTLFERDPSGMPWNLSPLVQVTAWQATALETVATSAPDRCPFVAEVF